MNKRTTEREAVSELRDGMTIGIGGWGSRRKPMSIVREILRSSVKDLTVVTYGGPDVGLLCNAGKIKRLVYGFVSLDSIPLEPHFRKARQAGSIQAAELDEGMLQWGLLAASHHLPFLPTRAGLGSDVLAINPDIKLGALARTPDGEELVAMPALELDVAFIHMNRGDERGNGQYLGPDPVLRRHVLPRGEAPLHERREDRRDRRHGEGGPAPDAHHQSHDGRRRDRGPRRRPLHRVPPRLRPRRGLPERLRRDREGPGGLARVQADTISTSRTRPSTRRRCASDDASSERGADARRDLRGGGGRGVSRQRRDPGVAASGRRRPSARGSRS